MLGVGILALVGAVALLAPVLFPGSPFRRVDRPFAPPFGRHLLGTDVLGRDVSAGIAHGARTSLTIGVVATSVAVAVGTVMGGLAGYYGGRIDDLLMRTTEFFQTIPTFLFAILLVAILAPSVWSIVFAIAVVNWPTVARLVRGEFLATRGREFVQACVGLGMRDARVIFRHVLPNCLSSIIVTGSLIVGTAILTESALSFLGLGDPNVMSWGFMIGAGRTFLRSAWWLCTIPGVAILLTVLAINLVGEGLNDALNPRLRR
jgi:peptide/nickel transport system permease protein